MDQKEHDVIHPIVTRFPCCISSRRLHSSSLDRFRKCHMDVVGSQRLVPYAIIDTNSINHLFGRAKTVSCRLRQLSVMLAHVVQRLWQTHIALAQWPPFAKVGLRTGGCYILPMGDVVVLIGNQKSLRNQKWTGGVVAWIHLASRTYKSFVCPVPAKRPTAKIEPN